jgi:hypothetical protein
MRTQPPQAPAPLNVLSDRQETPTTWQGVNAVRGLFTPTSA